MSEPLKTLSETFAELEHLPELHLGRIWLNALKAISAGELEVEAISGPDEYTSVVWEAMITVGSLSDGKPRFHAYPSGDAADDLASRDAAFKDILALKGGRADTGKLVELAKRMPSTTFAVLVRAHADGPDGPMIVEFLHHPDVSRRDAIGWLKRTVDFIREQETAAAGGDN